jgi:DTW domain-containing protein YfiP
MLTQVERARRPRFTMSRETCYRCFWPKPLCWCESIHPISTATRFVFLMHPKEYKQEKAATGRLTHLCLANSAIHVGIGFDDHPPVQELLRDPACHPVLLYPGRGALNLSAPCAPPHPLSEALAGKRLLVFLLDATWSLGKKMLRLSPSLQRLPRVMFTPREPSRFVIKQQPQAGCLSTLEATHELLTALESAGLDRYDRPAQLLDLFGRMQDFQIRCALDPVRPGYRRQPYSAPGERQPFSGRSGARRSRIFNSL